MAIKKEMLVLAFSLRRYSLPQRGRQLEGKTVSLSFLISWEQEVDSRQEEGPIFQSSRLTHP